MNHSKLRKDPSRIADIGYMSGLASSKGMVNGVLNSYMEEKDLEALRNENRHAAVDAFSPSAQKQRDEEQHPSPRAPTMSFDTTPDNAHPTQIPTHCGGKSNRQKPSLRQRTEELDNEGPDDVFKSVGKTGKASSGAAGTLRKKQPSASDLVTEQLLAHNLFLEAKLEDLVAALMSWEHTGVTSRHKRTPQGKAQEKKRTMFHAVSKGWRVGVFPTRELLSRSIDGYPKPKHKSFPSQKEAKKWLGAQLVETVTSDDEGSSEEGDEPSAGD
jgi:hypothetical protein